MVELFKVGDHLISKISINKNKEHLRFLNLLLKKENKTQKE